MDLVYTYTLNVLLGIDRFLNALFGGDPRETISSRLGKLELYYKGDIPWSRPIYKSIAWLCDHVQDNHCIKAIDPYSGQRSIVNGDIEEKINKKILKGDESEKD